MSGGGRHRRPLPEEFWLLIASAAFVFSILGGIGIIVWAVSQL